MENFFRDFASDFPGCVTLFHFYLAWKFRRPSDFLLCSSPNFVSLSTPLPALLSLDPFINASSIVGRFTTLIGLAYCRLKSPKEIHQLIIVTPHTTKMLKEDPCHTFIVQSILATMRAYQWQSFLLAQKMGRHDMKESRKGAGGILYRTRKLHNID